MDRVQIVAYIPENYADFIHLFRYGWWENVPTALYLGLTRPKYLFCVFIAFSIGILIFTVKIAICLVFLLVGIRILSIYFVYYKYEITAMKSNLKDRELKLYNTNPNTLLLAKMDSKIVGCISYIEKDSKTVEMRRLNVHPDFRGLKIGRLLIEHILAKAKDNGYKQMYIKTSSPNTSAQKLYEKLGIRQLENWLPFENYFIDICTGLYDIHYMKQLH